MLLRDKLDGEFFLDQGCIKSVTAVLNEMLAKSFNVNTEIIAKRHETGAALFKKTDWKTKDRQELRQNVADRFEEMVKGYSWNSPLSPEKSPSPVVLAIHGTTVSIAQKILSNGFATLSTTDNGYYGCGKASLKFPIW